MQTMTKWFWFSGVVLFFVLLYYLTPVLTPFAVAAVLAYLFDPIVNRLQVIKIPRAIGVVIVFFVILLLAGMILFYLIPLLEAQIIILFKKAPVFLGWASDLIQQYLGLQLNLSDKLSTEHIKGLLSHNLQQAGGIVSVMLRMITTSSLALVAWAVNLLLIPVVLFYLLRDWHEVVDGVYRLLPRRVVLTVKRLLGECNEVLSAFFRGQLLVMIALGILYSVGLTLVGVDLAVLIGMLSGLVSIVPYLGFIVGILSASMAAFFQYQEAIYLVYVAIVFLIVNGIESSMLTPLLIGDKIGLHPVAVIFAILAGGQLFGFIGVLLALPVAAVIMVFIRYFYQCYVNSQLYQMEHGRDEATR